MTKNSVLYITYDGLLDPLGASQILPYIRGIAGHPRKIYVLSFEKQARFKQGFEALNAELLALNVCWVPLIFSSHFGVAGKAYDFLIMHYHALRLAVSNRLKIVHARGHLSAQAGLFVKFFTKSKLIFDFRGFWVDERVDKGGWNLDSLMDKISFDLFKWMEKILLNKADQVIMLTHAALAEIEKIAPNTSSKITVIPCCADFSHFKWIDIKSREVVRSKFGVPHDALVIGFLGSIGKMYLFDKYVRLFQKILKEEKKAFALVVTNNKQEALDYFTKSIPDNISGSLKVTSASRLEVPMYLSCFDILVSFVTPTFAKIAMSPTKMAESLAMGVPIIMNEEGDVTALVKQLRAGYTVSDTSDIYLDAAVKQIPQILLMSGEKLRNAAETELSLRVAYSRYGAVYEKIDSLLMSSGETHA